MIPDPATLKFSHKLLTPEKANLPALVVGVFKGLKKPEGVLASIAKQTGAPVQELITSGEIRGVFKEFTTIPLGKGSPFRTMLVMGMGPKKSFNNDVLRSIMARAVRILRKIGRPRVAIVPSDFPGDVSHTVEALTEGTLLGLYKFAKYLDPDASPSRRPLNEVIFLHGDRKSLKAAKVASQKGEVMGWATNQARNLGNEPGNYCVPQTLAAEAKRLGKKHGLTVKVFEKKQLEKMGMGGILAVGSAGKNPPVLIAARYQGGRKGAPLIALVGKGITFDAGGVSIKSYKGMHTMKYDMCGAAAVLGALDAIAGLKLPVNILALIPSAENLLDSQGYKPGDLIQIYDGKRVEIIDTDAEGRLLLADALSYAVAQNASLLVDAATLTGGVIRAIGHVGSGIMGNNQWAIDLMIKAGKHYAEKMWQFPLWPEFNVHLKSTVATIANCHGSPVASTPTAAKFLQHFVNKTPWVHLDIAGTASTEEDSTLYYHKPYLPKRGATGVGVRTIAHFVELISEECGSDKKKLVQLLDDNMIEEWQ